MRGMAWQTVFEQHLDNHSPGVESGMISWTHRRISSPFNLKALRRLPGAAADSF